MNDMQAFQQRANEKRAAIGKPPVGKYEEIQVYTNAWSTFMRAVEHERLFYGYITDLAELTDEAQR